MEENTSKIDVLYLRLREFFLTEPDIGRFSIITQELARDWIDVALDQARQDGYWDGMDRGRAQVIDQKQLDEEPRFEAWYPHSDP